MTTTQGWPMLVSRRSLRIVPTITHAARVVALDGEALARTACGHWLFRPNPQAGPTTCQKCLAVIAGGADR